MDSSELLTVIGIIIALAAYLATVRGRILDKARTATGDDKIRLKRYAKMLVLADAPLVLSGALLSVYAGSKMFAHTASECLLLLGMSIFALALVVLMCFHVYEWYKSFTA